MPPIKLLQSCFNWSLFIKLSEVVLLKYKYFWTHPYKTPSLDCESPSQSPTRRCIDVAWGLKRRRRWKLTLISLRHCLTELSELWQDEFIWQGPQLILHGRCHSNKTNTYQNIKTYVPNEKCKAPARLNITKPDTSYKVVHEFTVYFMLGICFCLGWRIEFKTDY